MTGDERSNWNQIFLAVEAPNLTGFDSKRSRRHLGALIIAILAVGVTMFAVGSFDTSTPSPPTYPPLTFVTVPDP